MSGSTDMSLITKEIEAEEKKTTELFDHLKQKISFLKVCLIICFNDEDEELSFQMKNLSCELPINLLTLLDMYEVYCSISFRIRKMK
jgi:hypothetical protein